ncbi:hypothetical protein [Roseibium aestuarii]|uniref:Uncharacterized protein n=1 Tax=Roseibium aestuarii TaxID=2600299 RepID=A0ABW4JTU4_9HYPH|nr:hypothetical protein [Roseibium aestuarii]
MSRSFIATYFSAACLLLIVAAVQPGRGEAVAVISAPWSGLAAEVVAQAGGRIVSTSAGGRVAISQGGAGTGVGRFYAAGAIAVVSARVWQSCATMFSGERGR